MAPRGEARGAGRNRGVESRGGSAGGEARGGTEGDGTERRWTGGRGAQLSHLVRNFCFLRLPLWLLLEDEEEDPPLGPCCSPPRHITSHHITSHHIASVCLETLALVL